MSTKESLETRIKAQTRRIDDLTSLLEDQQRQHTELKRRFDTLRDDFGDQLASLRGRVTANERWGRKKEVEELQPATVEDILKTLSPTDRATLRAMLGTTSPPPTSGQSP